MSHLGLFITLTLSDQLISNESFESLVQAEAEGECGQRMQPFPFLHHI